MRNKHIIGHAGGEKVLKPLIRFSPAISIGLQFDATVSTPLTVNVVIVDKKGIPFNNPVIGAEGCVFVIASTNSKSLKGPVVLIRTNAYDDDGNPDDGLEYKATDALMTTDGVNWISNNKPTFKFFEFSGQADGWVWDINTAIGSGNTKIGPGKTFMLCVPVKVKSKYIITTTAIFEGGMAWDAVNPPPTAGSYTFYTKP